MSKKIKKIGVSQKTKSSTFKIVLDESGAESIRPESYKEPSVEELKGFALIGPPPED